MESLVNGLLDFFIAIFTIITSPIQNLINEYFPDLNVFASYFVSFFNMINVNWIPWLKDLSFIPNWTWQLIISYLIFHFTIAIFTNVLTHVAQWWSTLVP